MKKYAVLTREPRCFLGSFDFSWEQRKFEEIAVRSSVICSDDTLPRVEYEDIVSGTGRLNKDIYAKQSSKSGIVFHQGDVLYGKLRPYLQNWLLPTFDGLAVGDFWVLQPQNADSSFLYRLIQSRQFDEVANQSTGTKMPRADWKLVSKTVFSIPSNISEQAAIGTYFTALDSLITLHQRKCALLFSPFQAFISMMFITSTFSWEQRKLSEITDKVTEKNAGLQYVETFTNSAEFGIISQRDFFDHDIAKLGSLDGYYIVKTEDFVYNPRISTSAPVGPINRNKLGRTGVMSPLYTVFRPHDIDTTYLEYFFKCGYWHSFMNFNGDSGARSDRFSIRDNVFFQMPIPIPDIDEQRKIGELLTCLDNLITLHQRKFEKLTNVKKSMLEKMFPQNGSSYPEIRFKGFTDPWEQRKFDEVFDCTVPNNTLSRAELSYDEGTVLNVHYGDVLIKYGSVLDVQKDDIPRIPHRCREDFNGALLQDGDVIIADTAEDETTGKACEIGNLQGSAIVSGLHTMVCRPRNRMALGYLGYYLNSNAYHHQLLPLMQGIKVLSLSRSNIQKTSVSYPIAVKEQQLIAYYFSQLDNLITLHQRELEKLQNIKKSMLEKMFV